MKLVRSVLALLRVPAGRDKGRRMRGEWRHIGEGISGNLADNTELVGKRSKDGFSLLSHRLVLPFGCKDRHRRSGRRRTGKFKREAVREQV